MEKNRGLAPSLQATLDANRRLGELLQAHFAFAGETTGAPVTMLVSQIATQLHVDPRTVNNWVKGRHRPHGNMIQDLVDTLSQLIPVPQEVEDRHRVLEKQRKAIIAACLKRENNEVSADKLPQIAEADGFPPPSRPVLDIHRQPDTAPLRIVDQVKKPVFVWALAGLALFIVSWAANRVGHAGSNTHPAGDDLSSNSILIGGFEDPVLPDDKGSLYFPKNSIWRIWGRNGGGIQRNNSGWGADMAPEGKQTAFMHSGDVHISREIRIEPGTYNISLYASRRPYGRHVPNPIQIFVNGKEYSDLITPENTHFKQYKSRDFVVNTATSYTIEIATKSPQSPVGDTFVDKVELNPVQVNSGIDFLKNPFDILGGKMRGWGL